MFWRKRVPAPAEPQIDIVRERQGLVDFTIERRIYMPELAVVQNAATRAIAVIWEREMGRQTHLSLVLEGEVCMEYDDGREEAVGGIYLKEPDAILLGMHTLRNIYPHLTYDKTVAMFAGHEAMHRVQYYRGDPPPAEEEGTRSHVTHGYGRHEQEAYQAGVDAIGLVFGTSITLSHASHTYTTRMPQY